MAFSSFRRPDGSASAPIAKPAPPPIRVKSVPESAPETLYWTEETVRGWLISIAIHALLLVILAFWAFSPSINGPPILDTRLAGNEFGSTEGLTELGGLDAPIPIPESVAAPDASLITILKQEEIELPSDAGFSGNVTNKPGAGRGDGFGIARYGEGGEVIQGVKVKVGDPQFTLIWDTMTDIDLHVLEPGGTEISWTDMKSPRGGEMDVDNREGLGPENIYWLELKPDGSRDIGSGPPGEYKWFVHYYGGFNNANKPTRWKVRVKHAGQVKVYEGKLNVIDARSPTYSLRVDPKDQKKSASP